MKRLLNAFIVPVLMCGAALGQCTPGLRSMGAFAAAGVFKGVRAFGAFDGNLIVAGEFDQIGGVSAHNIAMWNGAAWQPLGEGTDGRVNCVVEYDSDGVHRLVVAGKFLHAGGLRVNNVAAWDGAGWVILGQTGGNLGQPGLGGSEVFALASVRFDAGNPALVFAAGNFGALDGMLRDGGGLACIDPAMPNNPWRAPFFDNPNDGPALGINGFGVPIGAFATSLATFHDQLYIGGSFLMMVAKGVAYPATHLTRLHPNSDGSWSFEQVGAEENQGVAASVMSMAVRALAPEEPERLIIGTELEQDTNQCVWQCDGESVEPLGDGAAFYLDPNDLKHFETAMAIDTFRGEPVVATKLIGPGNALSGRLLRLHEGVWTPIGSVFNRETQALRRADGELLIGGRFTAAGATSSVFLARYACACGADVNDDGVVDLADFFAFFSAFDLGAPAADVDGSGGVDLSDFFAFFGRFDAGC